MNSNKTIPTNKYGYELPPIVDFINEQIFNKAVGLLLEDGEIYASELQRRLEIGYRSAVELIGEMHKRGIVTSANLSKAVVSKEYTESVQNLGENKNNKNI